MTVLLLSLLGMVAAGLLALLAGHVARASTWIGVGGAWLFGILGLSSALRALLAGATVSFTAPWPVPGGAFSVELDPLSAWFLLPIFLLAPLVATSAAGFLATPRRATGFHWFLFQLLIAAMALVVLARNTVLFLVAWETMVLCAWGLMTLADDGEPAVNGALSWLIASHLGTAFLVALFLSADHGGWIERGVLGGDHALRYLLLALVGFGTKAALVPFHSWAAEAYGPAPGHLSALLSGAMSKLGIYGLLRLLFESGGFRIATASGAWILLAVGLASAGFGALAAVAQRDLRRVLAATSTESAGFVVTAIAVALLGRSVDANAIAVLGLAAALLHVVNDAIFKGLLFMGAGALVQATGTDRLDRMGGLLKLLPRAGLFLIVGASALLALPLFNGFASELLLMVGAFEGAITLPPPIAAPLFLVVGALALVAGLALAAFARAAGAALLGVPRDPAIASARDPTPLVLAPLGTLAALCLLGGIGAPLLLALARPVVAQALGDPQLWEWCWRHRAVDVITAGALSASLLGVLLLLVAWARRSLLAGRTVGETVTWDCGYHRPQPRMQYTASSFGQPLITFFGPLLLFRRRLERPEGLHASSASLATETRDVGHAWLYLPLFRLLAAVTTRLRILQHGRVHLYVLAIAATLLVLLLIEIA